MNKPIRHGEIMLVPVTSAPKAERTQYNEYIAGHSETGHHHVIESKTPFDVLVDNDQIFVELFSDAKLVHKKATDRHRDLVIPAGIYKRYHDTEYDPFEKIIREVAD